MDMNDVIAMVDVALERIDDEIDDAPDDLKLGRRLDGSYVRIENLRRAFAQLTPTDWKYLT